MGSDMEGEVHQRTRSNCPRYCKKFVCILVEDCGDECKKLDTAKAMLCELCTNPCETEKQKILLLDVEYYAEKKKLFSKNILEGVHGVKERHYYLETRYKEIKKKQFETKWYYTKTKSGHKNDAKLVRFELELLRKFMGMLKIPYEKTLDLEAKS